MEQGMDVTTNLLGSKVEMNSCPYKVSNQLNILKELIVRRKQ